MFTPSLPNRMLRMLGLSLAFAIIYACTDFALNRFGFTAGWTILWPLNGVTIAILLRHNRADWPAILAGVAIGTGIGECLDNNSIGLEIFLRSFSISEILLVALLLPAYKSLDEWLRQPRLFATFLVALVVGPGVSGILAAITFHIVQHQQYLAAFNDWATADALGIVATMPLALSFTFSEMSALFRRKNLLQTFSLLTAAFVLMAITLSVTRYPLLFLIFPTLLVVDFILSFAGAAVAGVGLCFIAIYQATHSIGVFGTWTPDLFVSRDIALQCFLGFHLLILFPVSILIRERRWLIADLNSSNAQLMMLASLDGLTGIANRRALDERLHQEWKRAIRLGSPISLIMIDVDHFKGYNDRYGHILGDQCLRLVAEQIAACVRRPQDLVARYGGEEFAVILPHTDTAGMIHIATTIRSAIYNLQIENEASSWKYVTVSLGTANRTPTRDMDQSKLLHAADLALYEAKRAGRNCVKTNATELVHTAESTN